MSEHNITVTGGTSTRLKTAGKYCDRDIIVTAAGGEGNDPYFLFPYVKAIRLTNLDIFNVSDLVINSDVLTTINQFAYGATNTKVKSIAFNTPVLTGVTQAFYNQSIIEEISFLNGINTSYATGVFQNCSNLKTINGILTLNGTSSTAYSDMFAGCSALVDVSLAENCLKVPISFGDSPNLGAKSTLRILKGLADLTGSTTQTLTVHSKVYEYIVNSGFDATYITAKNWTLVSIN